MFSETLKKLHNTHKLKYKNLPKIFSLYELNKEYFNKLKKWKEEEYSKIRSDLGMILDSQKLKQKDLSSVFIWLATQNSELLELNKNPKPLN